MTTGWTKREEDAAGAAVVSRLHNRILDLEDALEWIAATYGEALTPEDRDELEKVLRDD